MSDPRDTCETMEPTRVALFVVGAGRLPAALIELTHVGWVTKPLQVAEVLRQLEEVS